MERKTAGEFDQELLNLFDVRGMASTGAVFWRGRAVRCRWAPGHAADSLSPRSRRPQSRRTQRLRMRDRLRSAHGTGMSAPSGAARGFTATLPSSRSCTRTVLNPHIEDRTRLLALATSWASRGRPYPAEAPRDEEMR